MGNDMIRMSGMNSGLDTESIIEALTANSKLKITKQERNLLKYKAVQDGYRDVISKLTNLKNSYFDLLKKDKNLSGSSIWNKYSAKTIVDGTEKNIAGVSINTSINSAAGDYKIKVNKTATQSTIKGGSLSDGAKIDLDSAEEGKEYGMTVTVGDTTKNISFTAGANAEETRKNINDILAKEYGQSNATATSFSSEGMVYVDGNGKFVSRAGKGISISGMSGMGTNSKLDLSNVKTGNNTLSFQVGDEKVNVSFQTLSSDYFDDILDDDGKVKEDADPDKAALYNQVKDDYIDAKRYEDYSSWKELATDDDKSVLQHKAFDEAAEKQRLRYVDKYLDKEYSNYKSGLAEGEEAKSFDDWKAENFVDKDDSNELYAGFKDYYYDHPVTPTAEEAAERDEKLASFIDSEYDKYTAGLGEDETALDKDTWAENVKNGAEGYEDLNATYNAISDKYNNYSGYALDYDLWSAVSYNEYDAYKEYVNTVSEENLSFGKDDIISHYNETSLKNSVGNLETKSGVKFSIDVSGNSAAIKAEDKEGNAQSFSVVSAEGSKNNFGTSVASVSISQISNSTTLANLGVPADEDGKYSFSINGKNFSFDADTTVKDMMKSVNASDAGVKMSYSSLDNAFTVTSLEYGTAGKVEIGSDSQGLMSAIGLMAGSEYTAGANLEVEINGKLYESDGNSIEADGTTFTFTGAAEGTEFTASISKDTSAIADVIKNFVEDYNKVIKEVYDYLSEEPEKDYYFLADADKEQLELSEKEEEKWEAKAKKGILYHDSTISTAMTRLRTSLMGAITGIDGKAFSLSSMGIKTSSDYSEHGKLILDEDALKTAIEEHGDDIAKLFSGEDGIMKKFSDALNGAVGTTGDKGTLINKAGLATGSTAKDNQLYETMKRINSKITSLTSRYEHEQDRLWKKYSAMEKMLGTMNNQQSSFMSYFPQ